MGLYSSAGPQGTPADTGMAMGRGLYDAELAARTRYAEPAMGPDNPQPIVGAGTIGGEGRTDAPGYYNYGPDLPVKYSVPSAAKERLVARQAIREAAAGAPGGGTRIDPITDEEVNYLQAMKDQAELADFDRYVNSLIDPRKPGNLKWLMEIYPDFVNRRIQQVHTDYEYALRNQMIDSWGINTFDDLHFKYLADQGKIKGPYLQTDIEPGAQYSSGILSPFNWQSIRESGIRLPFASARFGKSAADGASWVMPDGRNPLSRGRNDAAMATSMYGTQDSVAQNPARDARDQPPRNTSRPTRP